MSYNQSLRLRGIAGRTLRPAGCAAIAAALASTTGPASAKTTLIDASYSCAVGARGKVSAHPVSCSGEPQSVDGTATGGASASAASSRDEVQAYVQIHAPPNNVANFEDIGLSAVSEYQVAVAVRSGKKPPPSITAVPIEITITGSVSCSGFSTEAQATVVVGLVVPLTPSAGCNILPNKPSFVDSETVPVSIGTPVPIEKDATADVSAFSAGDGETASASVHAVVDPTLEIDPSFVYADDFELEYSPGYAAVPEPATWTMLAVGFIALGVVRRRMKKRLSPGGDGAPGRRVFI
jgi:PEP-CTERM motif